MNGVESDNVVSEKKFKMYVSIQRSGLTNMFDVKTVCKLSNNLLSKDDCFYIMENYESLATLYEVY